MFKCKKAEIESGYIPNVDLPLPITAGDIIYADGSDWVVLAKGTALQELRMNAGATTLEYFTPAVINMALMEHGTGTVSGAGVQVVVTKTFSASDFANGDLCLIEAIVHQDTGGGGGAGDVSIEVYDGTNTVTANGGGSASDESHSLTGRVVHRANDNAAICVSGKSINFSTGVLSTLDSEGTGIANWIQSAWTLRLKVNPGDARNVWVEWNVYRMKSA